MDQTSPQSGTEAVSSPVRRSHVKICGLRTEAMIETVLSRGARDIGFVHFEASPRHVPMEDLSRLKAHVAGRALVTIVTVDPDDDLLERLMARVRPDVIQLHGAETPARVAEIAARTGIATMKAISVASADDLAQIALYRPVADRILLDAKAPKTSFIPGGNGVSFDWSLLAALGPEPDIVLSGGLNADNVGEAVRMVRPRGLDISSGVERAPGEKDAGLVHRFFDALDAAFLIDPERRAS